jgi:anti-anti-sigma factor
VAASADFLVFARSRREGADVPDVPHPRFAPTDPGFSCARRDEGPIVVVAVVGELDMATSPQLVDTLHDSAGAPMTVLDLSAARFIDSTGMRVILGAHDRRRAAGKRLLVVRGPAPVQRLFALAGVDDTLEVVDRPPMHFDAEASAVA